MPTAAGAWVLTGGAWKRKGRADRTAGVASFVHNVTEPTLTNTGRDAWAGKGTLSAYSGPNPITVAGTVIENKTINAHLEIRAANVVLRGCVIQGTTAPDTSDSGTALVNCINAACSNALIEFCDLIPTVPDRRVNGFLGHDFTARRNKILNGSDGAGVFNTNAPNTPVNVVFVDNYVDLLYFAFPADKADGTHNDGLQLSGGTGITIEGNTLRGYVDMTKGQANTPDNPRYPQPHALSCVITTPAVGSLGNVSIQYNWFYGGAPKLNIAQNGKGAIPGLVIAYNKFDDDNYYSGVYARVAASTQTLNQSTWVENRKMSNNAIVPFATIADD